jgi:CheY-like chemotaxis protein/anti-sigma regulatory factor (Ser/Thr protein kinase)
LRRAQQQVIQQERLAALGSMAGGIAHDFNNALSIIMGFGELLLRDAEHGLTKESATVPLTTILTAAEDAASIVHRLREFYRPDEPGEEHRAVDLNALIEQSIALTQPRWQTAASANGCAITVTTDPGEIPSIDGDPAELREAFTNLIFNAVDALPQGGTISFRTRRDGDSVTLTISDSGTGMGEEVRQRCLEPFFSTKGNAGTGLGLSMVFGVIQRHAGTIEVESELHQGTTFTLRLPADETASVIHCGPSSLLDRPLRILVVDDQPILCQLLCQYLEEDLHTVETALCGNDALEKFRARDFDLVITDHVMAEMTGEQLAATIKKINPLMPVILLTGYTCDPTAATEETPAAIDLILGKPLSRSALRHALAEVMALKTQAAGFSRRPLTEAQSDCAANT